jgi:hypothetical protein
MCEVLRRDSMTSSVPILVVTTETRPTELDRARDAGADSVLTKPVSLDALLQEIRRLLRSRERPNASATTAHESSESHTSLVKAHLPLETKSPPAKPPDLVCPSCDAPLVYKHSHIGGISSRQPEQWDHYTCPASCGTFEYRQRTCRLRCVV